MYRKVNKVKFNIEIGDASKVSTDVLFTWTSPKLNLGDAVFKKIHSEAGSTLYEQGLEAIMKYGELNQLGEQHIPAGRAIITQAGIMDVYYIIHCILPNRRIQLEKENRTMLLTNALQGGLFLALEYSKTITPLYKIAFYPISENIYGKVTREDVRLFWKVIMRIGKFKEIKLICSNQQEYDFYSNQFLRLNYTWLERTLNKIFKNKF